MLILDDAKQAYRQLDVTVREEQINLSVYQYRGDRQINTLMSIEETKTLIGNLQKALNELMLIDTEINQSQRYIALVDENEDDEPINGGALTWVQDAS